MLRVRERRPFLLGFLHGFIVLLSSRTCYPSAPYWKTLVRQRVLMESNWYFSLFLLFSLLFYYYWKLLDFLDFCYCDSTPIAQLNLDLISSKQKIQGLAGSSQV